jgi:hypothetical protein
MLPAKFDSIWQSSFRGEDFFNISQSETRIALGGHICWQITTLVSSSSFTSYHFGIFQFFHQLPFWYLQVLSPITLLVSPNFS